MKFYIDTANVDEIRSANDMGIIAGVTTNPSLIAKEGRDYAETLKEIATIVDGPISGEVKATTTDPEDMIAEGRAIYALDPKHMVVKIPMTAEGLKAIKVLSGEGIPTNCTLIFSANQALLAARAGATYVSPFLGRLDDIGQPGIDLIETIHDIFLNYPDIETQIIAASVRNPIHVTDCALAGADIATVPYKVIEQMLHHPLTDAGIDAESAVNLRVGSGGKLSVINTTADNMQSALNSNADLTNDLRAALKKMGVDMTNGLNFKLDDEGNLAVGNDVEQAEAINQWLKENPKLADAVKAQLEKRDVDASAVSLRLNSEGPVQISVNNAGLNDIQAVLDKQGEAGKKLHDGLDSLGVDPNIKFSIQVNDDGSVTVISDHADRDKVQQFFDDNPDLIKKYRQIETLSGIDDARKAMQVSPTAMRKRIQIESMAAWWADSGSASSYFGNYSGGNLSLLSGLNLNV